MKAVWSLIEHQQRFLFLQRAPGRGRAGQWTIPGGSIRSGETPELACVREVREETGLDIVTERPIALFAESVYFLCTADSTAVLLNHESVASQWISPSHLLALGEIMDLKRLLTVFALAGVNTIPIPPGLIPQEPDNVF